MSYVVELLPLSMRTSFEKRVEKETVAINTSRFIGPVGEPQDVFFCLFESAETIIEHAIKILQVVVVCNFAL